MSDHMEPRPEFLSHLEWQVRTAARRQERFSEPTEKTRGGKMNLVLLVMVSALMGAGGVVVKDEVQASRTQEVVLAKIDAETKMAELERQVASERLMEVERQHSAGMVGDEALIVARIRLTDAESRVASLHLDREEAEVTGKEPSNGLSAPLVDGTDYVTARIGLEMDGSTQRVELARLRMTKVAERVDVGAVGSEELMQARLALANAENHLSILQNRIGVRARFLHGEISAAEAEREADTFAARSELNVTRESLELARVRFRDLETRVDLGVISESHLQQARLELMQAETQLELLQVKLTALQGG